MGLGEEVFHCVGQVPVGIGQLLVTSNGTEKK